MDNNSPPTPQYQQPPLDPAFAELMAKSREQDVNAAKAGALQSKSSLEASYGKLTTGDLSDLLTKFGLTGTSISGATMSSPMLKQLGLS